MVRGVQLRSLVGAIPAFIVFGTSPDLPGIVIALLGVVLAAFIGVVRVLAWQRHTYEFAGGRIIEKSGIISRSERALEVERIQQVDVDRTLLDRLVGTCELRMETAADSGDSELTLRVISVQEADRLRALLTRRIGAATPMASTVTTVDSVDGDDAPPAPAPPAPTTELVRVPLHHVALAAVTGPRLVVVPAAIAFLASVVFENASPDRVLDTAESTVSAIGVIGGVLLGLLVLVVSVVAAGITGVVRDGGFTMSLRGDDLLVRRGLTTTRSATVPMRRVQRVTVRRRWLQGALGFASLTVHSAGGGGGGEGTQQLDRSLTVPLLPEGEVEALVARLLGGATVPPLRPHPPQARRRALVRGLLGVAGLAMPLTITAGVLRTPTPLVVAVVLLVLGATVGLLSFDKLASGADERLVASRTGLLGTTTELSPLRKTQGVRVSSSFFQRRLGLASVHVHVAGPAGGITLLDLGELTAKRLAPTLLD